MAILYGTTSDGDSLPVEVNEFGQLIAKGLQGQEGPPGPPGTGQLPPDPFEGAILGWKDNQLSWLGGSVPLPSNVFGPILSYENGVLSLESDISLPYLARVELSDSEGNPVFFSYSTSPITTVVDEPATALIKQIENSGQNVSIMNGLSVATEHVIATEDIFHAWIGVEGPVFIDDILPGAVFPVNAWSSADPVLNNPTSIRLNSGITSTIQQWKDYAFSSPYTALSTTTNTGEPEGGTVAELTFAVKETKGLYLSDSYNFDRFEVGMIVQSPDVAIDAINADDSFIRTSGGNWLGTDGSGVPAGEARVFTPDVTGEGTVQTTIGDSLVLREDNGNWLVGDYVLAPEQVLAARYVYQDEIRKRLV